MPLAEIVTGSYRTVSAIIASRGTDAIVANCEGSALDYLDNWVGALRAKIEARTESR